MSYVLEGIVFPAGRPDGSETYVSRIEFDLVAVDSDVSILARPGRPQFDDAVSDIAKEISKRRGAAMLVRWDDRVGVRESRVFRDGSQTHRFTTDDELYVMLDGDGMPLRSGRKYREAELDELEGNEEFEVFQNAIELGCGQSGFCKWDVLHKFIRRQG